MRELFCLVIGTSGTRYFVRILIHILVAVSDHRELPQEGNHICQIRGRYNPVSANRILLYIVQKLCIARFASQIRPSRLQDLNTVTLVVTSVISIVESRRELKSH